MIRWVSATSRLHPPPICNLPRRPQGNGCTLHSGLGPLEGARARRRFECGERVAVRGARLQNPRPGAQATQRQRRPKRTLAGPVRSQTPHGW